MEKLRQRLQRLQDLQNKKHEAYLATRDKAIKLKKDSFRLIMKVERAREQLMA